jgi:hypothetical protein
MKTKILGLLVVCGLSLLSCQKEEENTTAFGDDAKVHASIDLISDDISKIIDDQYQAQEASGGRYPYTSYLPDCADPSISVENGIWTRTIDFGTTGCQLINGNVLRGKIIVSGSTNFNLSPYIINYSFDNFFHNDKLIGGNRTASRTYQSTPALSTPHPVVDVEINLTITYPNGNIYIRTGNRKRECIEGYNTPEILNDNVYSITGVWSTTFPNGIQTTTITTPLIVKLNCRNIVSGEMNFVRNNSTANLNFGNGSCDNIAVYTINGNSYTISLGNP